MGTERNKEGNRVIRQCDVGIQFRRKFAEGRRIVSYYLFWSRDWRELSEWGENSKPSSWK